MITLKTGVPGSGKTLTAVAELLDATRGNWRLVDGQLIRVDPTAAARAVYTHGIPDLTVDCIPLPVFNPVEQRKGGETVQIRDRWEVDWSVVPDGALVVIDEAQRIFPVRGAGAAVPSYVAWLNTHRHRGIDLVLITQHPRLIDVAVRKLIGRHQHYRRLWGGQRHMVYEWDHCSDNLQGMKESTRKVSGFPRQAFTAYKSAEIHTKQTHSIPWAVGLPVLALVGLLAVSPKIYDLVTGIKSGQGVSAAAPGASSPAVAGASAPGASASAVAQLPQRADLLPVPGRAALPPAVPASYAYRDRWAASHWPVSIAGCWITAGRACECMTNGDRPRLVTDGGSMCVQVATGQLDPSPDRPRPAPVPDKDRAPAPPGAIPAAAVPQAAAPAPA